MFELKYKPGTIVWCKPTIISEPIQGTYIRCITKEENDEGYRRGEIVEINRKEIWIRSDLCNVDINVIKNL